MADENKENLADGKLSLDDKVQQAWGTPRGGWQVEKRRSGVPKPGEPREESIEERSSGTQRAGERIVRRSAGSRKSRGANGTKEARRRVSEVPSPKGLHLAYSSKRPLRVFHFGDHFRECDMDWSRHS